MNVLKEYNEGAEEKINISAKEILSELGEKDIIWAGTSSVYKHDSCLYGCVCLNRHELLAGLDFDMRVNREKEYVIFSIRSFINRLKTGNPVLLDQFFDRNETLFSSQKGDYLYNNAYMFLSKSLYHSYISYMLSLLRKSSRCRVPNRGKVEYLLEDMFRMYHRGTYLIENSSLEGYDDSGILEEVDKVKSGYYFSDSIGSRVNDKLFDVLAGMQDNLYNVTEQSNLPDKVDNDGLDEVLSVINEQIIFGI